MTISARKRKRMAAKDKVARKKFVYYVIGIVIIVLILMYFAFSSS